MLNVFQQHVRTNFVKSLICTLVHLACWCIHTFMGSHLLFITEHAHYFPPNTCNDLHMATYVLLRILWGCVSISYVLIKLMMVYWGNLWNPLIGIDVGDREPLRKWYFCFLLGIFVYICCYGMPFGDFRYRKCFALNEIQRRLCQIFLEIHALVNLSISRRL